MVQLIKMAGFRKLQQGGSIGELVRQIAELPMEKYVDLHIQKKHKPPVVATQTSMNSGSRYD
jgi:hypothetical protein